MATSRQDARSGARLLLDTLCLTPPTDSGDLAARWARTDPLSLVRLADREGAELWLLRRLKVLGIVLPREAHEALASEAKGLVARSARIDAEAIQALEILDSVGVPAIPLKSTALRRIADRVPYMDARGTVDVDVLVPEQLAQRGWEAFLPHGYVAPPVQGPPDGHHLPVLVRGSAGGVEIHITTKAPVSPAEAWRRATCDGAVAFFEGKTRAVPGDTELFWHSMDHGLFNAQVSGRFGIRLRHWLDVAAFLASGVEIDWDRILTRIAACETAPVARAYAWLGAAISLSGRPTPTKVREGVVAHAFNLERLLAWRLRVYARHDPDHRWANKMLEEGGRGEAHLSIGQLQSTPPLYGRLRYALTARVARVWWLIRR